MRSGGKQFRAEPDARIRVPRLNEAENAEIEISDVLLYADGDDKRIGKPVVEGVTVRAKVLGHGLGKKVLIKKFKRRKNYLRTRGHRQPFTLIQVIGIDA
jgi:large subunit ribosomal protein L21